MYKYLLFFILLSSYSFSQPKSIVSSIPPGFRILREYKCDFNLDGKQDELVLAGVNTDLDSTTLSRIFTDTFNYDTEILLLFTQKQDGSFQLATQNDHNIYNDPEIGVAAQIGNPMPEEITCDAGTFSLKYFSHGGGEHSTTQYIFRYSAELKDWVLEKRTVDAVSNESSGNGGYDNETVETKTSADFGLIRFKDFTGTEDY